MNARFLLGVLVLALLAAGVSAQYHTTAPMGSYAGWSGYNGAYQRAVSPYGYSFVQPRYMASVPRYTAYQDRPEGFGLVPERRAPYDFATHVCENHFVLGHPTRWDGSSTHYSALTGYPRTPPMLRARSNYCPPITTYNPNRYFYG